MTKSTELPDEIASAIARFEMASYRVSKVRDSDPGPYALHIQQEKDDAQRTMFEAILTAINEQFHDGWEQARLDHGNDTELRERAERLRRGAEWCCHDYDLAIAIKAYLQPGDLADNLVPREGAT